MKKKLLFVLTLALVSIGSAWADPIYKSDFSEGQIITTTAADVDAAVAAGWMAKGGKISGTKDLKNKLLIDPSTNAPYTSAPYTSETNFYIEKAYNATNDNDQSLYIYVTGVARIFFYAWCNSTPDGRTMDITVNEVAAGSITYSSGSANAQYTSVVLTKAANNIIRINGSNEVELTAIKVEVEETDEIVVSYDINGVAGIQGIAPANFNISGGSTFPLPANQTLYVDGKTLTGWNDGTTTHAIGETVTAAATDMTFTPVFTTNSATAYFGRTAATAVWNFKTSTGAPTWALEGVGGTGIQIAQAPIGGSNIDIKLAIDATSGKFNNASNTNWAQANSGTKLTVPTIVGTVVKVYTYSNAAAVTFNTTAGDFDATNKIYSYTATTDGNVDIVFGGNDYTSKVEVVYPSETELLTIAGSSVDVALTKANIKSNDFLAVSEEAWQEGKTYGGYTGDFYNMSKAARTLTIKVTGASAFEVFVQNSNAGRTYLVKVGSADAVEVTHPGGNVKSSGVFAIPDPSVETTITLSGGGNAAGSVYPVYIRFTPATITLGANGYSTFAASFKYTVSGATVYKAAYNGSDAVVLTAVANAVVPAGEGIILKGTEGDPVTIALSTEAASDFDGNGLVGVLTATAAPTNAYAIATIEGGVTKFHPCAGIEVPANKAYMIITGQNAPSLRIIEAENGATNIENVEANEAAVKFIENGKLYIKKNGVTYNVVGAVVK